MTGALSNLGPSMLRAMELAVEDINAHTAETRFSVEIVGKEDDTTTDQMRAVTAYDRLVALGAHAIAGPCCSGITGAILTKAVEDKVIVASPSATSPSLHDVNRDGFFWRISPTDADQGRALAQLVAGDGVTKTNLLVVNNDYGNGIASVFTSAFIALGGTVGSVAKVDETSTVVSSQVTEACSGNPGAVVLAVYASQGAEIIKAMQAQGCLSVVRVYASGGIYSPVLEMSVVELAGKDASGRWLAEGMKGTTPQAVDGTLFSAHYSARFGDAPGQFAAEAYDAVIMLGLSSFLAQSTEGAEVAPKLPIIANHHATPCRAFRDCARLIIADEAIDYVGYSHDLDYSPRNEPISGAYSYWRVDAQGGMVITRENVIPV